MPLKHPNCRCIMFLQPTPEQLTESQRKFWEEGCKMEAKLMLSEMGRSSLLRIPTEEEWVGLGLLERDDEL